MSRLGKNLSRQSGNEFWKGLEPNRIDFLVQTQNAGGFPGPVASTNPNISVLNTLFNSTDNQY